MTEQESAVLDGMVAPPAALQALTTDIGGVLESMEQVSDYLERVVHAVRRHVSGCDEVGVTIVTAGRPHTAAYTTVQTLAIDAVQYVLGDGPCLDAARNRRENRVDDLVVDDGRWPEVAKECRDDGRRSHATNRAGPRGSLASNQAKCRSSSILWSTRTEPSSSRKEMLIGGAAAKRQSVAHWWS